MRIKAILPAVCLLMGAHISGWALNNSPKDLLGDPAPAFAASRVISVTPVTRYIDVKGGEVVTFVAGGVSTTWSFDNPDMWAAKLSDIVPPDTLKQDVVVYVGRNWMYDAP